MRSGKLKIVAVGVSLAAVVALALPTTGAFANNYIDKDYLSYAAGHGVSYTAGYYKLDDSSSWDNCINGPNHTVEVALTPRDRWAVQFVGSPIYGWTGGKYGYLINYVWETSHAASALLWFNNTGDYGTWIGGKFSPDSI